MNLKKHKMSKISLFLFISIALNVLFISPYAIDYLRVDKTACYDSTATDNEVIASILDASMNTKGTKMSIHEHSGLFHDLYHMIKPFYHSIITNHFYSAYNYVGLSEYARKYNDKKIINFLIEKANSWIDSEGKFLYKFYIVDQSPIGILYLNLYKSTGDIKYKKAAKNVYSFLKGRVLNNYLIPYNNDKLNFTDAVGMYVPFLMEYYHQEGDSIAKKIALANIAQYQHYGVDKDSHLPMHGYDLKTGIKVGSANWGRGIGWYLLAIAYCPEMNDSILTHSVNQLPYTQFPLCPSNYDSSTALMFEIYKQAVNKDRKLNLDFIRTHIRKNGFVTDCSGETHGLNNYSHSFSNSELCNGLLLLLYSKFGN